MAFWGNEFIFDGIPCSMYGLMVYHFGSNDQDDVGFQDGDIVEDRIQGRYDALTYGLVQNQALEYTLVFGANMESMDAGESIDRTEVDSIASWLTGHQTRKWLAIVQDDMDLFRYKCFISDLKLITYGDYPWAFSCKVSCDSPFAYTYPKIYEYDVSGARQITFVNRSGYNGYFRPVLDISMKNGGDFSIQNATDGNRLFKFTGVPGSASLVVTVDNQNQLITANSGVNMYPYFNMHFLRLVRGANNLTITGNAHVKFTCVFPLNIGG